MPACFIHFKISPKYMHRGPRFISIFYIKGKSVHTALDIQRSKLVKIMVIDARFGSACKSKVLFTIVGSTSSTSTI
jgi:hypothetical protein